jgi:ribosomal protein L33
MRKMMEWERHYTDQEGGKNFLLCLGIVKFCTTCKKHVVWWRNSSGLAEADIWMNWLLALGMELEAPPSVGVWEWM